MRNGQLFYREHQSNPTTDSLDKIKAIFKRHPKLYALIVTTLSPLYLENHLGSFLKQTRKDSSVIVNLGSGNSDIANHVINVDLIPYGNVHIVSDIDKLPFRDQSVDIIVINSVLEHVPRPNLVVNEILRVLKLDGMLYASVPFLVGFHASPYDYNRWTREGVRVLFSGFKELKLIAEGGPTSALLWIAQEWLAGLLSFGNRQLFNLIYVFLLLLTWPIKFIDILMNKLPFSHHICSCFIFIGKKRQPT